MPVIATPVQQAVTTGISCATQIVTAPVVTQVEGVPSLAKMQAVECVQGQNRVIEYTMRSQYGDPVDLSTCVGATVIIRIREVTQMDSQNNPGVEIVGAISNANAGLITFTLTSVVVAFPGISLSEAAILNTNGDLIFSNTFWLIVNRGQFAAQTINNGPPTMAEIRLQMRDNDPADNLWLGTTEWDTAEIAACIALPIMYFNESQPPINQQFSTSNFPFRWHYLEAIIGHLYRIAALSYVRTHLSYQQQGGLQVDDRNKAPEYDKIAEQRLSNWKDFVLRKKVMYNALGAIQTLRSPYSGGYYGGGWGRGWYGN